MQHKVTVIGGGNVGATAAQRLVEREIADVCLIDVVEGLPQGKALDMMESAPVEKFGAMIAGSNTYEASAGSDIVVITAGLARKPGMSRDDLLHKNTGDRGSGLPGGVPAFARGDLHRCLEPARRDVRGRLKRITKLPRERVIGMAGILDSARMRWFIAEALNVSVENTHAFVLGGHGDTMVPLPRYSTVAGIPITELLPAEKVAQIVDRTRNGGAEIVNYLKTGSAYYAPSSAVVEMVDAILRDKKKILPCAVSLNGEYGYRDLFIGVPVKLGRRGAEEVIQIELTAEEKAGLKKSADAVKELCAILKV